MAHRYLEEIAPYNRRRGLPVASKAALLVIDMQRAFERLTTPVLGNVGALVDACRQAGTPVAFTQHGHRDPKVDGGMLARWWGDLIAYGSPGWGLVEGIAPRGDEPVFEKNRYSAFVDTDLEAWLLKRGVDQVVIAGVMTNCCCETTARDAFMRGFRVFFMADATGAVDETLHLSSLRTLAYGFAHVVETGDVCRALR